MATSRVPPASGKPDTRNAPTGLGWGGDRETVRAGTSTSKPRNATSRLTAAAADQACGRHDAGYGSGAVGSETPYPANSSGSR